MSRNDRDSERPSASHDPAGYAPSQRSAVAVSYAENDIAPRVVAKGYGPIAERIIEQAGAHGLYVHQSRELVQLLMQLDLDERIPASLYLAIAELLAWVYAIETTTPPSTDTSFTTR